MGRTKNPAKRVNYPNLITLISNSSEYPPHQVKDILDHYVGHMQELLLQGYEVDIHRLFRVRMAKYLLRNACIRGERTTAVAWKLMVKMSMGYKQIIRKHKSELYQSNKGELDVALEKMKKDERLTAYEKRIADWEADQARKKEERRLKKLAESATIESAEQPKE